jgi:MoxR-like ATPase
MEQRAADKLQALRQELKGLFVERDEFVDGALAALLARQHVLLIGPPGSGKSMIVHALCERIAGASYFRWLLTKFTTPEELFGPVSLQGLERDRYYRVTDGKLPKAQIAFLDEIFKANSAILNALLSLINERVYYNDATPTPVPLDTLFGASNLLPESRDLDCLFDRFLFRYQVAYIEESDGFRSMLEAPDEARGSAGLSLADLEQARADAGRVALGEQVIAWLTEIRSRIRGHGLVVSDRRFRLCLSGLRAHAYLAGRNCVEARDLRLLEHMLWSVPEERGSIEEIITAVVAPKLHAALQIMHQADDVHAKALQTWFNPDEERAAVVEAETKLLRLTQRLEDIRTDAVEDEIAPRLRQLGGRLASHLGDVETRKEQLAQDESLSASEGEPVHDGPGSNRSG